MCDTISLADILPRLQAPPTNNLYKTRQRHATLVVFNHLPIHCSEEGYGDSWHVTPLTVLSAQDAGYARVPYSKTMSKAKMTNAKPVAEMISPDSLKLYSFQKASMAKGERVDNISVEISPGDTFKIFMDLAKFKQMRQVSDTHQHLLPSGLDVIPAFSLLEMAVTAKNQETAEQKLSMVNIQTLRVMTGLTLYSAFASLKRLPESLESSVARGLSRVQQFSHFEKDLEKELVSFYVPECRTEASVEVVQVKDEEFARVSGWGEDEVEVDILKEDLLRMTNAIDAEHALNLLSVAFSLGAVSLLVVHDQFWERGGGSALRGVPLVLSHKLLQGLEAKNGEQSTGKQYDNGSEKQTILFNLGLEPVVSPGCPVKCPEFPFVLPGVEAKLGYPCNVSLGSSGSEDAVPDVVRFVCNPEALSKKGLSQGTKKRKLQSVVWNA